MDTTEAMRKIDEISAIIQSSNRAMFSGERMMVIGLMVALIPLIEIGTRFMTFGHDFGPNASLWITLIHTAFYWALFSLVGRILPFPRADRSDMHPLIKKAFEVRRPFMAAVFGVIFVFTAISQYQLIHPVIFLLFGFLFSIYGKFSIPAVSGIAWSYIAAGLIYAFLTRFDIQYLWICFTVYQGLSLILMGYLLKRRTRLDHAA